MKYKHPNRLDKFKHIIRAAAELLKWRMQQANAPVKELKPPVKQDAGMDYLP